MFEASVLGSKSVSELDAIKRDLDRKLTGSNGAFLATRRQRAYHAALASEAA
jgi:hypothetical protein